MRSAREFQLLCEHAWGDRRHSRFLSSTLQFSVVAVSSCNTSSSCTCSDSCRIVRDSSSHHSEGVVV